MSELFKPKQCVGVPGHALGVSRRTLTRVIYRTEEDINTLVRDVFAQWPEGLAPTNADAPVMPAVLALREAKEKMQKALDYLLNCVGDSTLL